jgi:hypothetical protein
MENATRIYGYTKNTGAKWLLLRNTSQTLGHCKRSQRTRRSHRQVQRHRDHRPQTHYTGGDSITKQRNTGQPLPRDLQTWLTTEIQRLDTAKHERYQANGYTPFYKFPIGETHIELVPQRPTPNTHYAGHMNFAIIVDGEPFTWSVTMTSPIYRQLLDALQQSQKQLTVVRIGQGLDTRWSLK